MKSDKFNKIVEARADERVQIRIREFRRNVDKLFNKLFDRQYYDDKEAKTVHAILASGQTNKGWRETTLWSEEEVAVSSELLATMDEFQKASLAVDRVKAEDEVE